MKVYTAPPFELMDIPRGVIFIFGCSVIVLLVTGKVIHRTWRFWTL